MGNYKNLVIVLIIALVTTGLFAASFEVQYKTSTTAATTNAITPHVQIVNNSGAAVAMNTLKIRYYYAKEGTAAEQFTCDYAAIGSSLVTGTFAAGYLEIGFTGGTINNGANSGEIQTRFNKTDWSNYDQSNDYSFVAQTAYAANSKICLYQNGNLVYGTPSGGTTAPTATPTPTVSVAGTPTRTATVAAGTATRTATTAAGTPTRTATTAVATPTRTATIAGGTPTRTATTAVGTATRTATTAVATPTRTATTGAATPTRTATATSFAGLVSILPATQTAARSAAFSNQVTVNTGTEVLAAYGFTVTYPSNLMSTTAASVTAGAQGFVSAVNANTAGSLVISGFDTTGKGPGTALALLNIAWTAGTSTGSGSVVLTVQSLINATYVNIGTPTGSSATVTIN